MNMKKLIAVAAVVASVLSARAATDMNWIDDPDNRGTEASPVNLYNKNKWTKGVLPSADYNLNFTAAGRTYITNTASASTQIATSLRFGGGDFVTFGPMKCASFGYNFSETAPVSVDKRGNWSFINDFRIATAADSHFTFTNRTGKLDICSGAAARIGSGNNSVSSFVLEGGSVTGSSSGYNLTVGYGTGSTSYFEQNGGTVSIAGRLQLGYGTGSTGRYVQNGGTATVGGSFFIGYNGAGELTINNGTFTVGSETWLGANGGSSKGYLNLNGGVFETPYICVPSSNGGGTVLFDGGTLRAAYKSDNTLVQGESRILIRIGARGGTIDTAGLNVNWGKSTLTADGVTSDGGLAIVGGGEFNITGNSTISRLDYNGRTTIEVGTRVSLPSTKVGGGAKFTIPTGLARATYNPLTTTGSLTLESVLADAVLPSDPNAQFVLSSDKKKILCAYGSFGGDPVWVGGVSNDLGDGANWSTGTVPQGGNCYIGIAYQDATLTSSASFRPDSITFTEGSKPVTISGADDIAGIVVVTNLSAVNHTINVPVRFADKIRVKQGAMAWASRNSPKVVFAGGAYGTSIDETYSRFVSGHYILSDETTQFVANQTQDVNRYGILAGSSLTVPCATNLTHLLNGLGGDTEETGGAFTTGVYRVLGTNVCRYNQGSTAEFVVTNEISMMLSEDKYLAYRWSNGAFKFEKVTLGDDGASRSFYFANNSDYYYEKNVWVGVGGLNFAEGASPSTVYRCGRMNDGGEIVYIRPWHSDYTIATKPGAVKDVLVNHPTHFGTTDENGVARTVTCNGIVDGTSSTWSKIYVDGSGRFVVNAVNTFIGPVTVNDTATLAINAGKRVTTGAVTVNSGATLKANSSGTVSFASNVVCKANTTLAFHFTEKRTAPCLVFNSAVAGNAMPSTLSIRITADDGRCPAGGRRTLTTGYDFTDTTLTLVDRPDWVKGVSVVDGDIVLEVKRKGLVVIVK